MGVNRFIRTDAARLADRQATCHQSGAILARKILKAHYAFAPFANGATDAITLSRSGRGYIKNMPSILSFKAYIFYMS